MKIFKNNFLILHLEFKPQNTEIKVGWLAGWLVGWLKTRGLSKNSSNYTYSIRPSSNKKIQTLPRQFV
jgi:hypothetical protein